MYTFFNIPCMIPSISLHTINSVDARCTFCVGQPRTILCEVPKQQGSLTCLEWRIDFEHSSRPSEASVTRLFTSADPEGHILKERRPGITFMFNHTSNGLSSLSLVSVLSITVDNILNATALINNATVDCGDEANRKILQVIKSNQYYCACMIASSQ